MFFVVDSFCDVKFSAQVIVPRFSWTASSQEVSFYNLADTGFFFQSSFFSFVSETYKMSNQDKDFCKLLGNVKLQQHYYKHHHLVVRSVRIVRKHVNKVRFHSFQNSNSFSEDILLNLVVRTTLKSALFEVKEANILPAE